MPTDYVMNRIVKGAKVKTTEHYDSECLRFFGVTTPIENAIVTEILVPKTQVVNVKLPNGNIKTINAFWLQLA